MRVVKYKREQVCVLCLFCAPPLPILTRREREREKDAGAYERGRSVMRDIQSLAEFLLRQPRRQFVQSTVCRVTTYAQQHFGYCKYSTKKRSRLKIARDILVADAVYTYIIVFELIMSSTATTSASVLSPRLRNTIKLRFLFNGHVHAQTFDCGETAAVPLSAPPYVAASQRYV